MASFAELGLHPTIVDAVTALGYEEPTPIQAEAIPLLREGRDLIGQAGTGTGKTAAFALPMLHRLVEARATSDGDEAPRPPKGTARALILVPTRELAMQVAEAVHQYSKGSQLSVVPVYGGAPMDNQIRLLRRGADVVVATPGRALDHLKRETLKLDALEVLVLDEADEMLDMGFADDLEELLRATPRTRQTALFAATMAPRIAKIAETHLNEPARVTIKAEKREAGTLPRVRQVAYIASRQQKSFALGRILEFEDPTSTIVFCRTRVEVDALTDTLKSHGYAAQALHGGMDQRQRDRVMQLVRDEKADILVATDVAARGLDIEHISHVINYDIPTAPEVYVHRIGRTGRAGREGVAITLVDPRERRTLRFIESAIKQTLQVAELPTLAALKAKRLEDTRAALQARIVSGGLDELKAFVGRLAEEFELADIAAAAVALTQDEDKSATPTLATSAAPAPRERREPREERAPRNFGTSEPRNSGTSEPRARRDFGPKAVLAFSVGEDDGVRPGDLVGAIAGESGIDSSQIGAIRVNPTFSTVEVPQEEVARITEALEGKTIRGNQFDMKEVPADQAPRPRPRPRDDDRGGDRYGAREGGFRPREGGYRDREREGGFRDRDGGGGFRGRNEGGFRDREREGGFRDRGEGGYRDREREGGFRDREGGGGFKKPGGYGAKPGGFRKPGGYGDKPGGFRKPGGYGSKPGGFKKGPRRD